MLSLLRALTTSHLCALWMGVVALSPSSAWAHDFWIEPTSFLSVPGQTIGVRLRVGENFVGDPVPRNAMLIEHFIIEDANGRHPIDGRAGDDPAGILRVGTPGTLIIAYRSKPSAITLAAEKFNQYLQEEGLDAVLAQRARHHQTGAEAREFYSRSAKSLLLSGSASEVQGDRQLGFTLELVAEKNPYTLRVDQALPVRLIYQNRPLAGALVVAMNQLNPAEKVMARTDEAGRVRLHLRRDGVWLIKAVHMVEAPAGAHADWVSYWASLTFALRTASAVPR